MTNFKYDYILSNGKYFVQLTEETVNYIDDLLTETLDCNYTIVNNKSVELNTSSTVHNLQNRKTSIFFKGKYKYLKILKPEITDTSEKKVHRSILNFVINYLEQEFNKYLIQELCK